ncbi:hypothetical protein P154DRAFT_320832 [Amniculicola lignicola CBS 123094]|uniref:Uncharacterized protein n=1 Tax=Amniculicola lignicola CBS 123094 TaxID=1392246 RepID=A0A6A5W3B4_9PLEO|nr:hypothetical protein P154DRAFT_320832 [Amniculicola lignicola CBS 123094]
MDRPCCGALDEQTQRHASCCQTPAPSHPLTLSRRPSSQSGCLACSPNCLPNCSPTCSTLNCAAEMRPWNLQSWHPPSPIPTPPAAGTLTARPIGLDCASRRPIVPFQHPKMKGGPVVERSMGGVGRRGSSGVGRVRGRGFFFPRTGSCRHRLGFRARLPSSVLAFFWGRVHQRGLDGCNVTRVTFTGTPIRGFPVLFGDPHMQESVLESYPGVLLFPLFAHTRYSQR